MMLTVHHIQPDGTGRKTYCLNCVCNGVTFQSIIDTGAMITILPRQVITQPKQYRQHQPVLIRDAVGKIKRRKTYDIPFSFVGHPLVFRPTRGVLIRDDDIGLIGLDIIESHLNLIIVDGKLSAEVY